MSLNSLTSKDDTEVCCLLNTQVYTVFKKVFSVPFESM